MLAVGRERVERAGLSDRIRLVHGTAQRLPSDDDQFAVVSFIYLLRYVEDHTATMRELARVTRPGERWRRRVRRPSRSLLARPWELYVRIGLPVVGRAISGDWYRVGRALGPTIRALPPPERIAEHWRAAGIGGRPGPQVEPGRRGRDLGHAELSVEPRPAFYALSGGWRDYVTLLHPPYTLWHLSYVVIGAALAPSLPAERLVWGLIAFMLALGVGAHALDELNGRPLKTSIPTGVPSAPRRRVDRRGRGDRPRRGARVDCMAAPVRRLGTFIVFAYNLELFGGRFPLRTRGSRSPGARFRC